MAEAPSLPALLAAELTRRGVGPTELARLMARRRRPRGNAAAIRVTLHKALDETPRAPGARPREMTWALFCEAAAALGLAVQVELVAEGEER